MSNTPLTDQINKTTQPHCLEDFLKNIQDPRRDAILRIYHDHKDLFHKAGGSTNNHQAWPGGYADHIAECLLVNDKVYDALAGIREPGFSKDSAAISLFFHDIEKPFKNISSTDPRVVKWQARQKDTGISWEDIKWVIIEEMKLEYNLSFTQDEINALTYTHGEGDDYLKDRRVSSPLAAHVHHCDNTSARIWHDYGREHNNNILK